MRTDTQAGPVTAGNRLRTLGLFLLVASVCAFLGVLVALNSYVYRLAIGKPISWGEASLYPFIDYGIWALLALLVLAMTARLKRILRFWPLWALGHIFISLGIMALHVLLWTPFRQVVAPAAAPFSLDVFQVLYVQNFYGDLWMYWSVVGLVHGIEYYRGLRESRIRTAELEQHLAQAELGVLKAQLQPHFLFNTLNTISALLHEDVDAADDMIGDLSALLRLSLERSGIHKVLLREELETLELYLNIQRIRFHDRLTIELKIDDSTLQAYVPHLILQPLVENAIRHGISRRASSGVVTIGADRHDALLRLRVSDNGPGLSPELERRNGIGLENTRERLQKLYGNQQSLRIDSSEQGFTVELEFPLVMAAETKGPESH